MANLDETSTFDANVDGINDGEDVTHTVANRPTQALTHRTRWLKTQLDNHTQATAPHTGHVNHSLALAINDFLVASGAGVWVRKSLADVKTILGLQAAAYLTVGTGSNQVAAGNHTHGNDSNIGGPYSLSGHTHAGVYATAGHGHANDGNIGGPYMTTARFQYAGQSGQPNWLWGTNDGVTMYVWNPANFSVNYATSAGNCDTIDGLQPSQLSVSYANSAGYAGDAGTASNAVKINNRQIWVSSSDPSGGNEGDIWIKYL